MGHCPRFPAVGGSERIDSADSVVGPQHYFGIVNGAAAEAVGSGVAGRPHPVDQPDVAPQATGVDWVIGRRKD